MAAAACSPRMWSRRAACTRIRSVDNAQQLVPVVSFASQWMTWLLLAGILLLNSFPQLLLAGIILFALTTLFSFITLPVEINASSVRWYGLAIPALRIHIIMRKRKMHSARLPIRM